MKFSELVHLLEKNGFAIVRMEGMKYTVIWVPKAEQELTEIWLSRLECLDDQN
jgi:predicted RNA binding protein YcfA (HicA-like mRNA interferase family)